jgi:hypothetical protein
LALGGIQQFQTGLDCGGHRLVALQGVVGGVESQHALACQVALDGVERFGDGHFLAPDTLPQGPVGQPQQDWPVTQLADQPQEAGVLSCRQIGAEQFPGIRCLHVADVQQFGFEGEGERVAGGDQAGTATAGGDDVPDLGLVPNVVEHQQQRALRQRRQQLGAGAWQRRTAVAVAAEGADQIGNLRARVGRILAQRHPQDAVAAGLQNGRVGAEQACEGGLAGTAEAAQADAVGQQLPVAVEQVRLDQGQLLRSLDVVGGRWRCLEGRLPGSARGPDVDADIAGVVAADIDPRRADRDGMLALRNGPAASELGVLAEAVGCGRDGARRRLPAAGFAACAIGGRSLQWLVEWLLVVPQFGAGGEKSLPVGHDDHSLLAMGSTQVRRQNCATILAGRPSHRTWGGSRLEARSGGKVA